MEKKLRRIEIRRGHSSQRTKVLYEEGEPIYLIDKKRIYIGDNTTFGGVLGSNVNFIVERKSIPERAVPSDIIFDKETATTYILNKNNELITLIDSAYCCEQLQKTIDEYNAYLNSVYLKYCACDGLMTDNDNLILTDIGECMLLDEKVEQECMPPYISNKTLKFNRNNNYILNIKNPLSEPAIVFDKNLPDSDINNPPKDIKILSTSVKVNGEGLSIVNYTDNTIELNVADNPVISDIPISLTYGLDNGCTTTTKTISGFIYAEIFKSSSDAGYLDYTISYKNSSYSILEDGYDGDRGRKEVGTTYDNLIKIKDYQYYKVRQYKGYNNFKLEETTLTIDNKIITSNVSKIITKNKGHNPSCVYTLVGSEKLITYGSYKLLETISNDDILDVNIDDLGIYYILKQTPNIIYDNNNNVIVKMELDVSITSMKGIGESRYVAFTTNKGDLYIYGTNDKKLKKYAENIQSVFDATSYSFVVLDTSGKYYYIDKIMIDDKKPLKEAKYFNNLSEYFKTL